MTTSPLAAAWSADFGWQAPSANATTAAAPTAAQRGSARVAVPTDLHSPPLRLCCPAISLSLEFLVPILSRQPPAASGYRYDAIAQRADLIDARHHHIPVLQRAARVH